MRRGLITLTALCFWAHATLAADGKVTDSGACTPDVETKAEDQIDHVSNWDGLYSFYTTYKSCDDGMVAELASDTVVKMLANQWYTLPTLAALVEKDGAFKTFVLRHINSTANTTELDKIALLSHKFCPQGERELCKTLEKAATDKPAISEDVAAEMALAMIKKHHLTTLREDCISLSTTENTWAFTVREVHDAQCGGDPDTEPALFDITVDNKTGVVKTNAINDTHDGDFWALR